MVPQETRIYNSKVGCEPQLIIERAEAALLSLYSKGSILNLVEYKSESCSS